jgi:release factor glutamine methyltransferase
LYVNFERPLDAQELADYRDKVRRRASREPVQYILGETEFWSLPFKVNPDVLIPRADTEVLVEEALKRFDGKGQILDVGTGSGAVAIALSKELPDARVTALDCSDEALAVARENAVTNQVAERISFLSGDLNDLPEGPFDMLVSNPPYIPSRDWESLMPEVHDHEPRLALDGGPDGLQAYRQLAVQAGALLIPGGWLLVEVGIDQAKDIAALFKAAGLDSIETRDDYSGIPRVVIGQKSCKV